MGTRAPANCDVEGIQGPDYDEVLQLEQQAPIAIPVTLPEPVQVRVNPGVSGQSLTVILSATVAARLVKSNPLRSRITIVSDGDYFLAFSKSEAEGRFGHIPAGVPITLMNTAELWVLAGTTGTYATAISGHWAH